MNHALKPSVISEIYRPAIVSALMYQIPFGICCLLMLDFGVAARVCGTAMLAHSLGAGLLISRRPFAPTAADLGFIRWGFWGIFFVCTIAQGMLQ